MCIRDGWLWCGCGKKIVPIYGNTTMINPDLLCKRCGEHLTPTIINGRLYFPEPESKNHKQSH